MPSLCDHVWKFKYSPSEGYLLDIFYIPALKCAVRYDRTTGYFTASALAAASKGVEGLVANKGKMRLICGCTLGEQEILAIQRGEDLKDTIEARILGNPFSEKNDHDRDALELLAWMVARQYLEVRLAVPWDIHANRPKDALFHIKAGIMEDSAHNRLAFNGSLNETEKAWTENWDTFNVYTSWRSGKEYLEAEEKSFCKLWDNTEPTARVLPLPEALERKLLEHAPKGDQLPRRLRSKDPVDDPRPAPDDVTAFENSEYEQTWIKIRESPANSPEGDMVGVATSAVSPWPHQLRAFRRMYDKWPPRLLIADEVGLGKTIQAGMIIRQAWMAKKARRILILAPKAVLIQWQLELREKFNLNVPIYDGGELRWAASPATGGGDTRKVGFSGWLGEPIVLASSYLMRRKERRKQLVDDAQPWDLVILDEAHHARRKNSAKGLDADSVNHLLALMQAIRDKTQGLVLLTATPMQMHPVEVWDLMNLLGLPEQWTAKNFLEFFEIMGDYDLHEQATPSTDTLVKLGRLFKDMENRFGPMDEQLALRVTGQFYQELDKSRQPGKAASIHAQAFAQNQYRLGAKKILGSLRELTNSSLNILSAELRRCALKIMKAYSPTQVLISRHTRSLLRAYHRQGRLGTNIATREVRDLLVDLSPAERALYEEVENYISETYNQASLDARNAIGFVMTIYRRRLASSFQALSCTLKNRVEKLSNDMSQPGGGDPAQLIQEELGDERAAQDGDILTEEDALKYEQTALQAEEIAHLSSLLEETRRLPVDTKLHSLVTVLRTLREEGYTQIIVFTQFTDTLDFLRRELARRQDCGRILCFSGRGGEQFADGGWEAISREKTKELFRAGEAELLLCTDAAAEGLNFQFCGAMINYDMPWNPMKVEQRIGRIDRLGQKFGTIHIVNLMYRNTVEADIYHALRERIGLFGDVIGNLQPILARIPDLFQDFVLQRKKQKAPAAAQVKKLIDSGIESQQSTGFNLDELSVMDFDMPKGIPPAYDLEFLHTVLANEHLLPHGFKAEPLAGGKDYKYIIPGMLEPIRVTTDAEYYEQHSESVELWSPGSPVFPWEKKLI